MKAIVTGSNGFIGYNLCQELKLQNWDVLGIDDLSSGLAENVVDGFQYIQAKIQDKVRMRELIGTFEPDVIFHLAAIPRVSYSVENPYDTAEAIILATISILEGVFRSGRAAHTRIVNTSSSSVYGGATILPTPESAHCDPKSPYALEKYQAEKWCTMLAGLYDIDVVSLRYFNVFGRHALFGGAYSTVLTAWLYHLYIDPSYAPFLEGDGSQSRDFCYVENVRQANLLAATRPEPFRGEVFNVAQGKAHTLLECKDLLEKISGKQLVLEQRPPRVGDVKHSLADITRAKRELGYDPSSDFEGQVARMAAWYQSSYPKSAIR